MDLPEPLLPVLWLVTVVGSALVNPRFTVPTTFLAADVALCTLLVLPSLLLLRRPTFGEGKRELEGTIDALCLGGFLHVCPTAPLYDLLCPDPVPVPPGRRDDVADVREGRLLEILDKELLRLSLGVVWVDVARCDILLSSRVLKWYGGAEV